MASAPGMAICPVNSRPSPAGATRYGKRRRSGGGRKYSRCLGAASAVFIGRGIARDMENWAELTGGEMKTTPRWIAVGFVGHQVIAVVLAVIVNLANATSVVGGIVVGVSGIESDQAVIDAQTWGSHRDG